MLPQFITATKGVSIKNGLALLFPCFVNYNDLILFNHTFAYFYVSSSLKQIGQLDQEKRAERE